MENTDGFARLQTVDDESPKRLSPLGLLVVSTVTTKANGTVFRIGRVRYVGPLPSFPCPTPSIDNNGAAANTNTMIIGNSKGENDGDNAVALVELMLRKAPPESGRYPHGTVFDAQLVEGIISPCFVAKPSSLYVVDMGTLKSLPTEVLEVIAEFGRWWPEKDFEDHPFRMAQNWENLLEQECREDERRWHTTVRRRKKLRTFRSAHPLARYLAVKGFTAHTPIVFATNETKQKRYAAELLTLSDHVEPTSPALERFLGAKNWQGGTMFHTAISAQNVPRIELLLRRVPQLLAVADGKKQLPLTLALTRATWARAETTEKILELMKQDGNALFTQCSTASLQRLLQVSLTQTKTWKRGDPALAIAQATAKLVFSVAVGQCQESKSNEIFEDCATVHAIIRHGTPPMFNAVFDPESSGMLKNQELVDLNQEWIEVEGTGTESLLTAAIAAKQWERAERLLGALKPYSNANDLRCCFTPMNNLRLSPLSAALYHCDPSSEKAEAVCRAVLMQAVEESESTLPERPREVAGEWVRFFALSVKHLSFFRYFKPAQLGGAHLVEFYRGLQSCAAAKNKDHREGFDLKEALEWLLSSLQELSLAQYLLDYAEAKWIFIPMLEVVVAKNAVPNVFLSCNDTLTFFKENRWAVPKLLETPANKQLLRPLWRHLLQSSNCSTFRSVFQLFVKSFENPIEMTQFEPLISSGEFWAIVQEIDFDESTGAESGTLPSFCYDERESNLVNARTIRQFPASLLPTDEQLLSEPSSSEVEPWLSAFLSKTLLEEACRSDAKTFVTFVGNALHHGRTWAVLLLLSKTMKEGLNDEIRGAPFSSIAFLWQHREAGALASILRSRGEQLFAANTLAEELELGREIFRFVEAMMNSRLSPETITFFIKHLHSVRLCEQLLSFVAAKLQEFDANPDAFWHEPEGVQTLYQEYFDAFAGLTGPSSSRGRTRYHRGEGGGGSSGAAEQPPQAPF